MADGNEGKILTSVAKTIGKAAGKIAAVTSTAVPEGGLAPEVASAPPSPTQTAPTKAAHPSKLPKKNKSRLPRRQKKALKAGTAQSK